MLKYGTGLQSQIQELSEKIEGTRAHIREQNHRRCTLQCERSALTQRLQLHHATVIPPTSFFCAGEHAECAVAHAYRDLAGTNWKDHLATSQAEYVHITTPVHRNAGASDYSSGGTSAGTGGSARGAFLTPLSAAGLPECKNIAQALTSAGSEAALTACAAHASTATHVTAAGEAGSALHMQTSRSWGTSPSSTPFMNEVGCLGLSALDQGAQSMMKPEKTEHSQIPLAASGCSEKASAVGLRDGMQEAGNGCQRLRGRRKCLRWVILESLTIEGYESCP